MNKPTVQSISPYITEQAVPYTITGPAIINIFAPSPATMPSLTNSIAGDTTEFEKPVIGTRVPAPACLAILSNKPRPVSSAAAKISDMLVRHLASLRESPAAKLNVSVSACPITHISPPEPKAERQSFKRLLLGEAFETSLPYSL